MFKSLVALFALATAVMAEMTPTEPGPKVIAKPGQPITISWTDGGNASNPSIATAWKSFKIDFMTGSNLNQVKLVTVVDNLDGTKQSNYSWTCPTVDKPSQIYFFMFTSGLGGVDAAWSTRFTITGPDGLTIKPAENPTQPDGSPIPWGIGSIVAGGVPGGSSAPVASGSALSSASSNITVSATGSAKSASSSAASVATTANTTTSNSTSISTTAVSKPSGASRTSVAVGIVGLIAGLVSFIL